MVDILAGSVDQHIFADPDLGSQNDANPTDSDPMHWLELSLFTTRVRRCPWKKKKNLLFF